MGHRVKTGIGVVAVSVALALLPTITASATIASTGSNPHSSLCKAYRSSVKPSAKGNAAAAAAGKAIQKGNWSAAKKAYLQTAAIETKDFQSLNSALSNAPSKVKSAAGVLGDYINQYKSALENSSSIKQFTKAATSLSKNAKITAAANTVSRYYMSVCGTGSS